MREVQGEVSSETEVLPPQPQTKQRGIDALFLKLCYEPPAGMKAFDRATELLCAGADPRAITEHGENALHLLVRGITCCDDCWKQVWRRELAQILVTMDAVDPNKRDGLGLTPRDVAQSKNFDEFSRELKDLVKLKGLGVDALRFSLGTRVEAMFDGCFRPGTIIALWDERNAYRIRLDTGVEIYAPKDVNIIVRAVSEAGLLLQAQEEEGGPGVEEEKRQEVDQIEMDFEPSDKETDELIAIIASRWSTPNVERRVKLDPQIYSTIKSSARASLNLLSRNASSDECNNQQRNRRKSRKKKSRR